MVTTLLAIVAVSCAVGYFAFTVYYIIKDHRKLTKRIERLETQTPKKKPTKAETEAYENSLRENGWVQQGIMWSKPNKDNEL